MKKDSAVKKETTGKVSSDLIIKSKDDSHSAHDQMSEQLTDYVNNVEKAVAEGKKNHDKDFYVVVLTKKERLMKNVLRNYFMTRNTCPTPEWDQTVYRYHNGYIEYLWTVPAKDICAHLTYNALSVPQEEKQLLGFVLSFQDGSLLRLSKKLNGELDDSPLLA